MKCLLGLEEMQTCINSFTKIRKVLQEPKQEDIQKGEQVEQLIGDIEFENVCFQYENQEVLQHISFIIKQGTKATIVGRTGVGKTTLTNLLMRLYEPQSGTIYIGGKNIKQISIKSIRNSISYISQNPYLFADTLRNNITLGNSNITDAQIMELVEELEVSFLFEKLQKGLEEQVTQTSLSLGELQVVAFLRAILHQATIYIFDEPTSNIDLKTEKMIQNCIDKISKNSTVIVIAHRKATIANADKIIYLKEGKVDRITNKVPC